MSSEGHETNRWVALALTAVVAATAGLSIGTFLEGRNTRDQLSRLRAEVAASGVDALQARVAVLETKLDEVSQTQGQQTTGLVGVRSQIAKIVGTQSGFVPLGTPSLIQLGQDLGTSDTQDQLNALQGDVRSLQECVLDLKNAVDFGDSVFGCIFF